MNKNIYKPISFWSWNGNLEKKELIKQIDWMHDQGIGGFFMHVRGSLGGEYLSEKWFDWVSSSFKDFNDYFANLGEKLTNSKEFVSVGVIYFIRSCYFSYKNQDSYNSIKDIKDSLTETCETLNRFHVPFNILDETLLEDDGSVSFNKFNLNLMSYDVVILPRVYTLSNNTTRLLKEFN